jgi:ESCRT-I complex subunit TSG101
MSGNQQALLEQCLSRIPFYSNVHRLRQDMQVLFYNLTNNSLRPNVGNFQTASGNITLFYLAGVVPITFMGNNYNIPVTIYFDPPYPNQPPRVFVTPTAEMVIKPNHRSVDMNGRVYLPQLTNWSPYTSNLVELVGILSSVFSAEPPVNSKKTLSAHVVTPRPPPAPLQAVVVGGPTRTDQLIKSLTVKIRAKLPVKLKAEVDAINDLRTKNVKFTSHMKEVEKLNREVSTYLTDHCIKKQLELETRIAETIEWNKMNRISKSEIDSPSEGGVAALKYLDAESVVGQQIIDLLAEECAIEDLIDSLNESVRRGKMSMSDLLKEIRSLTRRLFEVKTIKKKALVVIQSNRKANAVPRISN